MQFAVRLTDGAAVDLQDLSHYIAGARGGAEARQVIDRIRQALSNLSESPNRGAYPKEFLDLGIREYREVFFNRLLKNDASPPERVGYAQEKDAGSANSRAICATEDVLSRRPVRSGGLGFVLQQPAKPYRIVYRVTESDVRVLLITDGRRDLRALLQPRLLAP
jgi:plasmid stabilization system protein ParE